MYNIKKKKIWTKRFSDLELNNIWLAFEKVTPYLNEAKIENGKDLDKAISYLGFFVHPETDYRNDTLGIEPKTLKKWLSYNSIEDLTDTLFLLCITAPIFSEQNHSMIEDGHFNWNKYFKLICFKEKEPLSFKDSILNFLNIQNLNYDIEILKQNYWLLGLMTKEFRNKYSDLNNFILTKIDLWKRKFKRAPKSLILVSLVNPENFDFEYLKWIEKIYLTNSIMELSLIEQYKVSIAIMSRPIRLITNSQTYINYFLNRFNEKVFPEIPKNILNKLSKKIIENTDYNSLSKVFFELDSTKANLIVDKINNLAKSNNFEQINRLLTYFTEVRKITVKKYIEFAYSLPTNVIFSMCNQHGVTHAVFSIDRYLSLWEQRSQNKDLKPISFTSGKYKAELMDSNDLDSLILGEVTDCCQVIYGQGESCLLSGLKNKTQGFIKVTKKGKIFAQSWYWTAKTKDNKKVICFDSIELLSENLNQGKEIVNAYIGLGKILIDNFNYSIVLAGNDGQSIPKELSKDYPISNELTYHKENLIFEKPLDTLNERLKTYSDTNQLGVVTLVENIKEK